MKPVQQLEDLDSIKKTIDDIWDAAAFSETEINNRLDLLQKYQELFLSRLSEGNNDPRLLDLITQIQKNNKSDKDVKSLVLDCAIVESEIAFLKVEVEFVQSGDNPSHDLIIRKNICQCEVDKFNDLLNSDPNQAELNLLNDVLWNKSIKFKRQVLASKDDVKEKLVAVLQNAQDAWQGLNEVVGQSEDQTIINSLQEWYDASDKFNAAKEILRLTKLDNSKKKIDDIWDDQGIAMGQELLQEYLELFKLRLGRGDDELLNSYITAIEELPEGSQISNDFVFNCAILESEMTQAEVIGDDANAIIKRDLYICEIDKFQNLKKFSNTGSALGELKVESAKMMMGFRKAMLVSTDEDLKAKFADALQSNEWDGLKEALSISSDNEIKNIEANHLKVLDMIDLETQRINDAAEEVIAPLRREKDEAGKVILQKGSEAKQNLIKITNKFIKPSILRPALREQDEEKAIPRAIIELNRSGKDKLSLVDATNLRTAIEKAIRSEIEAHTDCDTGVVSPDTGAQVKIYEEHLGEKEGYFSKATKSSESFKFGKSFFKMNEKIDFFSKMKGEVENKEYDADLFEKLLEKEQGDAVIRPCESNLEKFKNAFGERVKELNQAGHNDAEELAQMELKLRKSFVEELFVRRELMNSGKEVDKDLEFKRIAATQKYLTSYLKHNNVNVVVDADFIAAGQHFGKDSVVNTDEETLESLKRKMEIAELKEKKSLELAKSKARGGATAELPKIRKKLRNLRKDEIPESGENHNNARQSRITKKSLPVISMEDAENALNEAQAELQQLQSNANGEDSQQLINAQQVKVITAEIVKKRLEISQAQPDRVVALKTDLKSLEKKREKFEGEQSRKVEFNFPNLGSNERTQEEYELSPLTEDQQWQLNEEANKKALEAVKNARHKNKKDVDAGEIDNKALLNLDNQELQVKSQLIALQKKLIGKRSTSGEEVDRDTLREYSLKAMIESKASLKIQKGLDVKIDNTENSEITNTKKFAELKGAVSVSKSSLFSGIVKQGTPALIKATIKWQEAIEKEGSEEVASARAKWEAELSVSGNQEIQKFKQSFDLAEIELEIAKADIRNQGLKQEWQSRAADHPKLIDENNNLRSVEDIILTVFAQRNGDDVPEKGQSKNIVNTYFKCREIFEAVQEVLILQSKKQAISDPDNEELKKEIKKNKIGKEILLAEQELAKAIFTAHGLEGSDFETLFETGISEPRAIKPLAINPLSQARIDVARAALELVELKQQLGVEENQDDLPQLIELKKQQKEGLDAKLQEEILKKEFKDVGNDNQQSLNQRVAISAQARKNNQKRNSKTFELAPKKSDVEEVEDNEHELDEVEVSFERLKSHLFRELSVSLHGEIVNEQNEIDLGKIDAVIANLESEKGLITKLQDIRGYIDQEDDDAWDLLAQLPQPLQGSIIVDGAISSYKVDEKIKEEESKDYTDISELTKLKNNVIQAKCGKGYDADFSNNLRESFEVSEDSYEYVILELKRKRLKHRGDITDEEKIAQIQKDKVVALRKKFEAEYDADCGLITAQQKFDFEKLEAQGELSVLSNKVLTNVFTATKALQNLQKSLALTAEEEGARSKEVEELRAQQVASVKKAKAENKDGNLTDSSGSEFNLNDTIPPYTRNNLFQKVSVGVEFINREASPEEETKFDNLIAAGKLREAIIKQAEFEFDPNLVNSDGKWSQSEDENEVQKWQEFCESVGIEPSYLARKSRQHSFDIDCAKQKIEIAQSELTIVNLKEKLLGDVKDDASVKSSDEDTIGDDDEDELDEEAIKSQIKLEELRKEWLAAKLQELVLQKEFDDVGKDDRVLKDTNERFLKQQRIEVAEKYFDLRTVEFELQHSNGSLSDEELRNALSDLDEELKKVKEREKQSEEEKRERLLQKRLQKALEEDEKLVRPYVEENRKMKVVANENGLLDEMRPIKNGNDVADYRRKKIEKLTDEEIIEQYGERKKVEKDDKTTSPLTNEQKEFKKISWKRGKYETLEVFSPEEISSTKSVNIQSAQEENKVLSFDMTSPKTSVQNPQAVKLYLIDPRNPGAAFENDERSNKFRVAAFCYKNDREIAKTMAAIICAAAKEAQLDLDRATVVINSARESGGVKHSYEGGSYKENDKLNFSNADKNFSALFQKKCKECGIYSGRADKGNLNKPLVGLRTAFIPQEVLDLLQERKDVQPIATDKDLLEQKKEKVEDIRKAKLATSENFR